MAPVETRRAFIGKFAGMVAGTLCAGASLSAEEKEQAGDVDVNQWMRVVQAETFRGIGEVIPHAVKGADELLVVIDQGHFSPSHLPWMLRSTEQCQREICTAVQDLQSNTHTALRELFMEGVVAGEEKATLRRVGQELRINMAAVPDASPVDEFLQLPVRQTPFETRIRSPYFLNAVLPFEFDVEENGQWRTKIVETSSLAHIGAGLILAYRGDLTMKGAEDEAILRTARSINSEEDPEHYNLWANEKRERNVLELASKRSGRILYVIFGMRHKWEERIDEWNRENDTTFSLLRLRPKEMVKVLEILSEL